MRLRLRLYALLSGISGSLGNNFVPYQVAVTGAAATSVAYAQGVNGLGSGFVQVVASGPMARSSWKAGWLFASTLLLGLLWLLLPLFASGVPLLILFTLTVLLGGLQGLALQMVVGHHSRPWARGRDLSTIAFLSGLGGLLAFALAAVLTGIYHDVRLLYGLAGAIYVAAAVCGAGLGEGGEAPRLYWRESEEDALAMRKFLLASGVFGFFWGFAWPLFTLTQAKVIGMRYYEYSVAQLLALLSTLAFQPLAGVFVDKGPRKALFFSRLGLAAFPLGFALSTKAWQVYVINGATGLISALVNISSAGYIYAAAEPQAWARYLAQYNMVNGVLTMAGSIAGGLSVDLLLPHLGLQGALFASYQLAFVGRVVSSLLFLRLREPPRTRG